MNALRPITNHTSPITNHHPRSFVYRLWSFVLLVTACASPPTPIAPSPTLPLSPSTAVPPVTPIPPSPTPPLPALRQLTTGGCCTGPFWSPDGSEVWFVDKPDASAPSGIWGVAVSGGGPRLVAERVGIYSPDRSLVAYPEGGQTVVERVGGERWSVPSDGRAISFSPDGTRIAWQVASSTFDFDRRAVSLWLANVDGGDARQVAQWTGGGFIGWLPDGQRLLVAGRDPQTRLPFLAVLHLASGDLTRIVEGADPGARLRGGVPSPGGGWLAYQVTFSGNPAQDGLWVVRPDGTGARRLDLFGAYRWRAEGRLLVVPLEADAPSHRIVEFDAGTGEARAVTDPALAPFRIANGDWTVSPDGARIAFVSAEDHSIWVMELP